MSLPWLVTTWIGPPLGAFFQRRGPAGYRAAYAVFGILLPLVAGLLFCTLWLEWRKIRRKALEEGRKPCTRDLGFGVTTRRHRHEHVHAHSPLATDGRRFSTSGSDSHIDLEEGTTLSARERREASAAETAAKEMTKRKRWNMSTWSKAVELWKDLDVLGLVALTAGCILFLLPFTLATKRPESWGDCASRSHLSLPRARLLTLVTLLRRARSVHLDLDPVGRLDPRLFRFLRTARRGPLDSAPLAQEPDDPRGFGDRVLSLLQPVLLRELFHEFPAVSPPTGALLADRLLTSPCLRTESPADTRRKTLPTSGGPLSRIRTKRIGVN